MNEHFRELLGNADIDLANDIALVDGRRLDALIKAVAADCARTADCPYPVSAIRHRYDLDTRKNKNTAASGGE